MPGKCLLFFKRSCPNYFDDIQAANVDSLNGGDTLTYTISVLNSGLGNGTITRIFDDLPIGFTYIPGSTSGITSLDPLITDQNLSWDGTWSIQKGVSKIETLSFDVKVSIEAGNYLGLSGVGTFTTLNEGRRCQSSFTRRYAYIYCGIYEHW